MARREAPPVQRRVPVAVLLRVEVEEDRKPLIRAPGPALLRPSSGGAHSLRGWAAESRAEQEQGPAVWCGG